MGLVVLQFGMIAVEATIARDVPLVLMHVLLGIVRVSVVMAIFAHADEWGNDIMLTFQQVGQQIAGFTPDATGPSEVLNKGLQIFWAVLTAKAHGGWIEETIQSIEFILAAVAILFAWAVASLIYLGTLIEAALIVYAGPLVISVTPLSWTFDLLIVWARTLLSIAFKLALILMTLGVGMGLANGWIAAMDPASFTTNVWNFVLMVIESAIFGYCTWKIPNKLSGMVPGAAMLGFGEAIAAGAGSAAKSIGSSAGTAGRAISSVGSAAAHGAQALGHQAMALAQKVQSKLNS